MFEGEMLAARACVRHASFIAAAEYAQRRTLLMETVRAGPDARDGDIIVLLRGASRTFYAPDVPYPFRQRSSFRYLTGCTEPSATVLLYASAEKGGRPMTILAIPQKTDHEKLWDGEGTSEMELAELAGGDVTSEAKLLSTLDQLVKSDTLLAYEPDDWKNSGVAQEILTRSKRMTRLRDAVHKVRWRKSDTEIQLIRETTRIGAEAMNRLIEEGTTLKNERAAVGLLEWEWRRRGAAGQAYPPVVASGSRANTIHYLDSNREIPEGSTLLVDAGCDLDGYVSDITRCFPAAGKFSEPQRELYDALDSVHTTLLNRVQSDEPLSLNDLYGLMIEELAVVLKEIGLFPASFDKKELRKATEEICPHHVSHYLGMDVHDCGSVSRNERLRPGVVFTVEPGVYVRETNKLTRAEFRGIGYRIEDDVLKTKDGAEILTAGAVREASEIEELMKSRSYDSSV